MNFNLYFVDTFTSTPFKGNPTSVCNTDSFPPPGTMQAIAAELNLPVTAFITKTNERPGHYDIRYFTPVTEIPACGHGTLGSSRIALMHEKVDTVTFHTIEGREISAASKQDSIMMSYPRFEWKETKPEKETLNSLGISSYLSAAISTELETLFIELESGEQIRKIQPDYARMVKSSNSIVEVVITSASDDEKYDYLLRSFCPWIGIDEDPVTGSVHSVLGTFWQGKLKKNVLKAYQASQRGGEVLINASGNNIEIGGKTVIIMQGEMSY
jgi:PhzF family phenazine biosynthesis protein